MDTRYLQKKTMNENIPFIGPQVLSVREVARILKVSGETVYRAIREDSFPHIHIGTRKLVPVIKLRALIDGEYKHIPCLSCNERRNIVTEFSKPILF